MTNFVTTKRALLTSVLSLVLCFAMLLGTTFAWFTDTVTSSGNVIQTGDLKVKLWQHTSETAKVEITDESDPIFGAADNTSANDNTANTLWEPGKTQTVYFSIENAGTLDLKYMVAIEVTDITENLNEVLSYIVTPDAEFGEINERTDLDWTKGSKVNSGVNYATNGDVNLVEGAIHHFALSVHMDELAGNEYKNASITFNIKVLATQMSSEFDSFGRDYDENSMYPDGFYSLPALTEFPAAGHEIEYLNENKEKIGTLTIPATALPEGANTVYYAVGEDVTVPNFTVSADFIGSKTFDITVNGLKENNEEPVKAKVRIEKGLADALITENNKEISVTVYHHKADGTYETLPATYNNESGLVEFSTTSFSPFTIAWRVIDSMPADIPHASVTYAQEHVNTAIEWGSYGQWSPNATVDAKPKLEAAFVFTTPHTSESIENCEYKDWYCDYVVSLDRDLGANQIFLGGNYGSFGWVGFHNGDLELGANEEIPLLGSVTSNPWTYEAIVKNVGTFTCGVSDVNNALEGAVFTVKLRLTNPNNTNEYYDVNVVTYTFGGTYTIQ